MIYKRHYLQYNDLVFDEADMIIEDDASVSFKTFESDYGWGHGAYSPQKRKGLWAEAGRVSFSITLKMKKLPCEQRPYYVRFAKSQLTTQGKLWAIQDNTIIWAYAILENFVEVNDSRRNEAIFDVDFSIPEGVWHKANKLKTFLLPYDKCDFMDCYDYHDIDQCGCCSCEPRNDTCDCCDCIEKDMALCYHTGELQNFYDKCGGGYKLVYDCAMAEKFFGGYYSDAQWGQKICSDCNKPIDGFLYSDTDIPTENVTITLHGAMKDPYVEINGNGNIIKGEYDGTLIIKPDGSVYFTKDIDCPACDPLDVSVWEIPENMEYGWTVYQGKNHIVVDPGECCMVCAYFEVDALAI